MFFLGWLTRNRIEWEFEDYCDLTTLILKDEYRVKMFYSYCLSINDLQNTTLIPGDHVVNLHNWNNGPSSNEADRICAFFRYKKYTTKTNFLLFVIAKSNERYTQSIARGMYRGYWFF